MPRTSQKPGRGGKRPGAGRKPPLLPGSDTERQEPRNITITAAISITCKQWIEANYGSAGLALHALMESSPPGTIAE